MCNHTAQTVNTRLLRCFTTVINCLTVYFTAPQSDWVSSAECGLLRTNHASRNVTLCLILVISFSSTFFFLTGRTVFLGCCLFSHHLAAVWERLWPILEININQSFLLMRNCSIDAPQHTHTHTTESANKNPYKCCTDARSR